MTYPELMQHIVKLPGWTWEWKFGDMGFYGNETVIILGSNNRGFIGTWRPSIKDTDVLKVNGLVPLPSVEQLDELFDKAGYDLHVKRTGPTFKVIAVSRTTGNRAQIYCDEKHT
jgi:hypothetical protein